MRKSIWISSLLIVLCVSLTLAGFTRLNRSGEQIQFEETVLSGDKSVLEGLSVTHHMFEQAGQGYLYWDTVYRPGMEPSAQTKFTYTEKSTEEQDPAEGEYLSISHFSRASTDDGKADFLKTGGKWTTVLAKLAERAGSASQYEAWVDLNDYFDYLPLQIDVNIGNLNLLSVDPEADGAEPWTEQLRDVFRLPLPEKCTARVKIWKQSDGSVYQFTVSMKSNLPRLVTESVVTDKYCYLLVIGEMLDGSPLSTADGQDLCGIYRIPYEKVEEEAAFGATWQKTVLRVEDMVKTVSVEPGTRIVDLSYDEERDRIEMVYQVERAEEPIQAKMLVVDGKTGEEVQTVMLSEDTKGHGIYGVFSNGNARLIYTMFGGSDSFVLLNCNGEGIYEKEFTAFLPVETELDHLTWSWWFAGTHEIGMAFDGERLALAGTVYYSEDAFQLLVYEAGEIVFQGVYKNSLNFGGNSGSQHWGTKPVEVNWE